MSEWKTYRLGDLVKIKGGKRLPKGVALTKHHNSHPYIKIRDIGNSKIIELDSSFEYVDDETQKSIAQYIVQKGDLLISIVGTIGLVGVVGASLNQANQTENCAKLTDFQNIDRDYLYYFLKSQQGQEEIKKGIVGAVQAKLPLKNIENILVQAPTITTQRRIAGILGALDDKIELNRRINANLEEQAEALYYNLCIDDDNEFDLCEFADIYSGKSIKPQKSGLYPILGANGEIGRTNDFLFNDRLIYTGRVGTLGKIYRVENKKVWMSDNTLIIKPKIGYNFIYFALKNTDIHSYNVGSTQPLIRQSDIKGIKIFFPTFETLQNFEQISDTLFSQINNNNDQNTILAALRDTLLPKLMNGETIIDSVSLD